eukprot:TRINITY_DN56477_c0_g1_i1.p1 TRINITY_DN56477_c0_g1~~TRINITY_DN56477_c0_g1_i1.p1  ORF type:complete len:485 (-),score=45.63 TRINITY_DN56477_c0_g1_i1:187-1557(-)
MAAEFEGDAVIPGGAPWCVMGCGLPAAPGVDEGGNPCKVCCRGCATGVGHDASCVNADLLPPQNVAVIGSASADVVSERLCIRGCGLPAGHGFDRRGLPFATCCADCARGRGHDMFCGLSLEAAAALRSELQPRRWRRLREVFYKIWDPVWGTIEFRHVQPGMPIPKRTTFAWLFYSTCPCLMITFGCCRDEVHSGLSKAELRRAWRRLLLSGSMLLGILQVAVFLATLVVEYNTRDSTYQNEPLLSPSVFVLDDFGAKNAALILYRHEWWRLITPIFLHGGWFHLIGNVFVQCRTALVLECLWGTPVWLVVYFVSGIIATLASCIAVPDYLGVGSSGALCGMIGAWLPFILITWNQTLPGDVVERNTQLIVVILAVLIIVPTSFLPMVDFAAHFGGLVSGATLSMALFGNRLQTRSWRIVTLVVGVVATLSIVVVCLWLLFDRVKPNKALLEIGI